MPKRTAFSGYNKELRVRMTDGMYRDLKVIADRQERSVAAMVRVMVALCIDTMREGSHANGE